MGWDGIGGFSFLTCMIYCVFFSFLFLFVCLFVCLNYVYDDGMVMCIINVCKMGFWYEYM